MDHADLNFPTEVAMFGLPMGAVIESWPAQLNNNINNKTSFNTFVLNVNSDGGAITEKVYGASIMFYENYDHTQLSYEQRLLLGYIELDDDVKKRKLYSNKSLILLSRYPLFEAFRDFLTFIFNKFMKNFNWDDIIPIEKYLTHLIYDVPFPTHKKPRVLVNLTDTLKDYLTLNLPDECILPQS